MAARYESARPTSSAVVRVMVILLWLLHVEFAWRWMFVVFTGKVTGSVTPRASRRPDCPKTVRARVRECCVRKSVVNVCECVCEIVVYVCVCVCVDI